MNMPLKSLVTLWVAIATTFPIKPMSIARISRTTSINFLTVTMPAMGKILDKSLTLGQLQSFKGLTRTYRGTSYPVFLREFFEIIFHENGMIRDEIDTVVLRQLRTLLFMFYKYEIEPTPEQLSLAEQKFIETDAQVMEHYTDDQLSSLRPVFNTVFNSIDPDALVGHHSNGATEGKYTNAEKRDIFRIIPSLCSYYDLKYFFNTYNHYKWYKDVNGIPAIVEPHARVAFVPKDSRGPRTICIEPHERMYVQQALMAELYQVMENTFPFRGRVNFTDQSINANLALSSSYTRSYATLDLKDASDLVSWNLIKNLVPPQWKAPIEALRTPEAVLPSGKICKLKKFAPMGSALCFPIEALLFFSICRTVCADVYVYGDDIICPKDRAIECIAALESYGLKVNTDKSLYYGDFRESCGTDAFRGSVITPLRYRRDDLVSVVAFANNLSEAFGTHTGEAVIRWYESINHTIIPRLSHDFKCTEAIAFYTEHDNSIMFASRYNKALQYHELRLKSVCATDRRRSQDSYGHLYDYYSQKYGCNAGFGDYLHLKDPVNRRDISGQIYGRLTLSKDRIKYRWVRDLSRG